MKNQIITLTIGILIGAVITTIVFVAIRSTEKKPKNDKFPEGFEEKMKGERPSFDTSNMPSRRDRNKESNSNETKSE